MLTPTRPSRLQLPAALLGLLTGLSTLPAQAAVCAARSSDTPPRLVELYTSEGCSSCPPADRWLSGLPSLPSLPSLPGGEDVIAVSFHVNYWDMLGWPDRFASAANTERQRAIQGPSGARQLYTPQVLVDGRDWRRWPGLPPAADAPAQRPVVTLQSQGDQVIASVGGLAPRGGAGGERLEGWWAVVEDGHRSAVRRGENAGRDLRHDHVVRQYLPVPPWSAGESVQHRMPLGTRDAAASGRRVIFVVTPLGSSRPLQVVAAAC